MISFFSCAFVTLPIIGLYFSLMRWHFLVAWLLTATTGVLLPYFATSLLSQFSRRYWGPGLTAYWVICAFQISLAAFAYFRLRRNLEDPSFALEHGM
ncbi:MAG: hypothetical protein FJ403_05100 [Verrucomicrobia bacterium]|nr:hypothetical protein [Verrucomicrobiota bacterium]